MALQLREPQGRPQPPAQHPEEPPEQLQQDAAQEPPAQHPQEPAQEPAQEAAAQQPPHLQEPAEQQPADGQAHNNADAGEEDDENAEPNVIDANLLQVSDTCPTEMMPNLRIISVRVCETSDYALNPQVCENTALVAVVLSIRMFNNKNTLITSGGSRVSSRNNPNSAAQRAMNANTNPVKYDRIVTLADCSSSRSEGDVFACMMTSKGLSDRFFANMKIGQEGIGNLVVIEEAFPVDSTLGMGTNVALIKRVGPVLPLRNSMVSLVPSIPITAPDKGDTRYFCQHSDTSVVFSSAQIEDAICGGFLWYDRIAFSMSHPLWFPIFQWPFSFIISPLFIIVSDRQQTPSGNKGQACGCLFMPVRHYPLVLQASVIFNVPRSFRKVGRMNINGFRSYRTTLLFVTEEALGRFKSFNANHIQALRVAINRVNNYVNTNGGWTYIGWLRTGTVMDQSDQTAYKDAENIASMTQDPHLSYLYPTDANAQAFSYTNAQYQRLRLRAVELE